MEKLRPNGYIGVTNDWFPWFTLRKACGLHPLTPATPFPFAESTDGNPIELNIDGKNIECSAGDSKTDDAYLSFMISVSVVYTSP